MLLSIKRSLVNVIWLLSCCSLPVWAESLKIEKVTGENSFLLSDKREFVLRHIEMAYPQIPSLEIAKIDIIDHADRYNRVPALLFLSDGEEVAHYLLKMGLAKLHPREGEPLIDPTYLSLEATARNQKKGLWDDDIHRVKNAGETGLQKYVGLYQLIEGSITHFQAFGEKHEMTLDHQVKIRIDKDVKAVDSSAGLADFTHSIGVRVAIRGWLGDFHGLIVNVGRMDQIELLP